MLPYLCDNHQHVEKLYNRVSINFCTSYDNATQGKYFLVACTRLYNLLCPSVQPSIRLSVRPSVCLSVCPSVCLSVGQTLLFLFTLGYS